MADLLADLRAATKHIHEHLETLPYHLALIKGELPKVSALCYLRALATLHAPLESALRSPNSSELSDLFESCGPKLPAILADLKTLHDPEGVPSPSLTGAAAAACSFANSIITRLNDPFHLAGVLYVLEGSQSGGVQLKQLYAQVLGVQPDALTYFGFYGNQTRSKWRSFTEKLAVLHLTPEQTASVIAAATTSFESIETILRALYPYSDNDLVFHVSALNPEAGDHPIPQNPKELEFSLRAGKRAWKKYDYLEKRFGERGKRFTTSDSCWLVALSQLSQEATTQSLKWLRKVLASRGLPTVILEYHLREIQNEMKADGYNSLTIASYDGFLAALESERNSSFDSEMLAAVIHKYDAVFKSAPGEKVDHAAELIVSAWLDGKAGVPEALSSLQKWLTDTNVFSPNWVNAVEEIVVALDAIEVRV